MLIIDIIYLVLIFITTVLKFMVRWRRGYAPACKAEYTGSNRSAPQKINVFTNIKIKLLLFKFSGVAQLVEQATGNRWVTGSSPVAGAIFLVVLFGEIFGKDKFCLSYI